MNTISILILSIIGIVLLPTVMTVIVCAIWEIIQVPYRVLMVAIYGVAYIAVIAYEVLACSISLPFRIAGWISRRTHCQQNSSPQPS